MRVEGLDAIAAGFIATDAVAFAVRAAPKLTGEAASNMAPIFGTGFFGIRWTLPYLWYQEMGIRAFTMNKLAGKTIPMWIDDPTGRERSQNPRAQTRVTESGRIQILIFRRAANKGQRKMRKMPDGTMRDVPASYPGAPGRIAKREAARPWTTSGKVGGQIAKGNVGVRWRHPGMESRYFMHDALEIAAARNSVFPGEIFTSVGSVQF